MPLGSKLCRTRSLKASVTRAITSLLKGDYVAFRPERERWPGREAPAHSASYEAQKAWVQSLPPEEALALSWGYALRPKGLEVGLKHEALLDPVDVLVAVRRLQFPGWQVRDFMLPVLDERIRAVTRPPMEATAA